MPDFDELVSTEAYLIWQSEGCPHGMHDRHWSMAVERVRARLSVKTETPIIPLSFKRVMLSNAKRKPQDNVRLRASA